jgi:hypothetical protein
MEIGRIHLPHAELGTASVIVNNRAKLPKRVFA